MIYYGVCGEGLAHSMRAILLVEKLKRPTTFFSYGDGYEFIKSCGFPVKKIDGMEFKISGDKINQFQTIKSGLKFLWNMQPEMNGSPELCISDWEPTICKFARKNNIPLISTASQHKFKFWDSSRLPLRYRAYSQLAKLFCEFFPADKYIIPTSQLKFINKADNVYPVNSFIDPSLRNISKDFTLIYAKPKGLREELSNKYPEAIVFGEQKNRNFHYYLARAKEVHATAGCQLIGECLFLKKKLVTYPIQGQIEQEINHFDYINTPPNSYYSNGLDEAVRIINEM